MNINGLIKAVHDFSSYVIGKEFLTMIIETVDRQHVSELRQAEPEKYEHRGYQERRIKTSAGELKLRFTRLRNRETNKSTSPGLGFLNCPAYTRWTNEVVKDAASLLPFMSFRNSSEEYAEQHGFSPGKSTIHRRLEDLVGNGDYRPELTKKQYKYLLVDGTGARFQNRSEEQEGSFYKGEVRLAYASTGEVRPFELVGLWISKSWKECAEDLYSRISSKRLEVLISDGEEGIVSSFLLPHMRQQRCYVHALRDLSFVLYADGQKKNEQEEVFQEVLRLPLLGGSQNDFEELTSESIAEVKRARDQIQTGLQELATATIAKGYRNAGTYLQRLSEPLVTCLDYFINTGRIVPITSNYIERQIGLFKNRYNRVGRRWSEEGLAKWFAIAIRKLLPQFDWKECWKDIIGSKSAVELKLQSCSITLLVP